MGTLVEVVLYPDTQVVRDAAQEAFRRMETIEKEAHPYREGNPLDRLRKGEDVTLAGDLERILTEGLAVARASSGAYDPTLGEVISLWGFNGDQPSLPDGERLRNALARSGYRKLTPSPCCPGGERLWLDLGGVAKGFAVDEAVRVLREAGVAAGIVNAGGDLRSFGTRPGRGVWKIGVQDPEEPQGLAGVLEVEEISVATSGDYQRYFEKDGVRYHHILDPATGYPARSGARSTTVIAPDCAAADALATASFVLGPEKGLKLLEEWGGVEGIIIDTEGRFHKTSGIGQKYPFEER